MEKRSGYQDREREHFDRLAVEASDWWGAQTPAGKERFRVRARMIRAALADRTDPEVLEVGCGTGAFSYYVLEAMPILSFTGCDISPKSLELALERCKGFPNAKFMIADITKPAHGFHKVDAAVGNGVLHHIDLRVALSFCRSILKPGGFILFFEPNMLNPQVALEKNVPFFRRLTQTSDDETAFFRWPLREKLAEAGFERISVQPMDFLHPLCPESLMPILNGAGRLAEKLPLVRELGGSLAITAYAQEKGA